MKFLNNTLVQFAVSGLALGIGFVVPALWVLALPGVWLFVRAVLEAQKTKIVFLGGFLSWFIKMFLVLSWGVSIYPIDWFMVPLPGQGIYGIAFYWIVGSLLLSFGGLVLAGVIRLFKNSSENKLWLSLPFLWIMAEVISAYFFSIITWGPGSYLNAAYSYGFVGYLLAEHPVLLMFAKWGGVYALSIVLVGMVGLGIFLYKKYGLVSGFALLLIAAGYLVSSPSYSNGEKTVAIVETEFNSQLNRGDRVSERKDKVVEALDAALLTESKYIVMPEVSQYSNLGLGPEGAYQMFRFQNKDPKVVLVDSGQAMTAEGDLIVRATLIDGEAKAAWQFDKQYLVPQGEFIPSLFTGILKILGGSEMANTLRDNFNYVPGPIKSQSAIPENLPRVLFCFSSADPTAVRELVDGAEVPFVAHVTSHAWFREAVTLWQQQSAMLKVQAVWSGVPIVQSANMGPSMVYLPNGTSYRPEVVAEGELWRVLTTKI
jgi:apolipoprotein N-acyltransferase